MKNKKMAQKKKKEHNAAAYERTRNSYQCKCATIKKDHKIHMHLQKNVHGKFASPRSPS